MRPRFRPAIADAAAAQRPGQAAGRIGWGCHGRALTPTWNAIGLSLPVVFDARDAIGSLSPWHSFLPPRGGGQFGSRAPRSEPESLLALANISRLDARRAHVSASDGACRWLDGRDKPDHDN